MKETMRNNYLQLCNAAGLSLDEKCGIMYGHFGGFNLIVFARDARYPYSLTVRMSAGRPQGPLSKEVCKETVKNNKAMTLLEMKGFVVNMYLRNNANMAGLSQSLVESLMTLTGLLRANGFENCCQVCGRPADTAGYGIGTADYKLLCPECSVSMAQNLNTHAQQTAGKKENVIAGIVGAFLGSLLGVLCIVFLGQMGFIASVSGLIMAICTIKGYELLGGKLSTVGIIVTVVLMVIMTFVGNQLDWAVAVMRQLDYDFISSIQIIPELLEAGMIESGAYWGSLFMVYVFAALGAVPTVINAKKNQGIEHRMFRIG